MLKLKGLVIVSLLLGMGFLIPQTSDAESTALISMDFEDVCLKDVLKIFSKQTGLNFIASEGVKEKKLTLYFEKAPIQEALNTILIANNLTYEQIEGTNILIVKESKEIIEVEEQPITQIFPLKYARVAKFVSECGAKEGTGGSKEGAVGIKSAVEKLLSGKGRMADDLRTNSLIVIDTPSQLKIIEDVIAKLDMPTPQVMIEVEMIDVTKKVVDNLGVDWSGAFGTYTGPIRETVYPFSQIFPPGPHGWDVGTSITVGTMNMTGLTAALKALVTDTNTRYLARPRILTLNNETAEIAIKTDEAISLSTSTSTVGDVGTVTKKVERAETGVLLKVTPQINEEGYITMFIQPSVSEAVAGTISDGVQTVKDPETRGTTSTVRLKDGETIVIGGLIRNRSTETIKKLPLLGDIPVLGALFRHRERTKPNDRELIVFITPHIIKEAGAQVAWLDEETVSEEEVIPEAAEEIPLLQPERVGRSRRDEIESALDRLEER